MIHMNEWRLRLLTGGMALAFALLWLFWMPENWFLLCLALLGLLATQELLSMLKMPQLPGMLLGAPSWLGLCLGLPLAAVLLWQTATWSALTLWSVRQDAARLPAALTRLAWAQWMMLWLLLFAWSLIELRTQTHGLWWLAGACFGVWVADTAAYVCGRRWGRRKLCPAISPGKTLAGIAGGLSFGGLCAAAIWHVQISLSWSWAIPLALALVALAILGDLNESALKRIVGVKDSGRILPGHGGILDRIDALLPSIPMVASVAPWMMPA